MPLKIARGNMYKWVSHVHSHIGGKCPHDCIYCYVPAIGKRAPGLLAKYSGEIRILPGELAVRYGTGKTIFVDHMADLFAVGVTDEMIVEVLRHCAAWPENEFVYQTKNPARMKEFLNQMPPKVIFGTTIETNRETPEISKAPSPRARYEAMRELRKLTTAKIFLTVEPILSFDLAELVEIITTLKPDFLNIGADSKDRGLIEPTQAEVLALVAALRPHGIEVREKANLARLIAS